MMLRELVIDSFAGGGGASTGIAMALGRDPDIAVNHDPMALAMHRINHPGTRHIEEDVVTVDARAMCGGRPIGLLWMSPDCKHHSKAKGGKPRDRNIRGLAWTVVGWVKALPPWQRPRVVALENVEEFADWGPLREDGKPCPIQKGAIFREFVRGWEALGYVVEWRERRAYISGARTIRKRLYMIMRRDGEPIVWPEARFGDPASAEVKAGLLQPWGTAADCIDWDLPCPSIFDTSAEIKATHGIRAIRPLAENTMARIAKGTMRYVVNAERPFLVRVNHGDSRGRRDRGLDEPLPTATRYGGDALVQPFVAQVNHGGAAAGRDHAVDEPMPTMTAGRGEALVTPFVTYAQQGGLSRAAGDPLHTFTASPKDQNQVVMPFVTKFNRGATGHAVDEPLHTVTAHASDTHGGGAAPLGIVVPHVMTMRSAEKPFGSANEPAHTVTAGGAGLTMVGAFLSPRYQEKPGDAPRVRGVDEPTATILAGDNVPGHLCTPFLVPRYGERQGQEPRAVPADAPAPTVTPTGNEGHLAAVHLSRQFGASVGSAADVPVGTITAGGAGKAAVVAAFLAQQNHGEKPCAAADEPARTVTTQNNRLTLIAAHLAQHNTDPEPKPGSPVDVPVSTITASGSQQGLVAASLINMRGSDRRDAPVDAPAPTSSAQGNHAAAVYAFLAKYYGAGVPSQAADDPLHTVTAKPRHGLVEVLIAGEPFVIVDIGMRMLTPRERYRANGFPESTIIDRGLLADGTEVPFTLEQQGRFCGNSVCPTEARDLVAANFQVREVRTPRRRRAAPATDLFTPRLQAAE